MASRLELFFTIVSILMSGSETGASQAFRQPTIYSSLPIEKGIQENYQTVTSSDNHTLFCQGDKPLKWRTPKTKVNWTRFVTQPIQPSNGTSYKFESRLDIINMTYLYVGFYYCLYTDVDADNTDGSDKIYLYVNDTDHLACELGEYTMKRVIVIWDQEAVLPCKPTSPDIEVKLLNKNHEIKLNTLTSDTQTIYHYDPMHGIITNDTKRQKRDILKCNFSRNDKKKLIIINLLVEVPISHLYTPLLTDLNKGHTIEGKKLQLRCIIQVTAPLNTIEFFFTTPNEPRDPSRTEMVNPQRKERNGKNYVSQTFAILNASIEDKGTYMCNVTDKQGHSSATRLNINVFGRNESFLNVTVINKTFSIVASAGNNFSQFDAIVQGHPLPTIVWRNNVNNTISINNKTKYEVYNSNHVASLRIKNIILSDMGHYQLLATNNKTEIRHFFLNVTDRPSVRIETDRIHLINTPSRVKCFVSANPEPKIEWRYKFCQGKQCNLPINGTLLKKGFYSFISEAFINTSSSVTVECSARNHMGYNDTFAELYVSDVENGFDIFGLDSTVDLNKEKTVAIVAIGEPARMICGASKYYYSNIKWYIRDKVVTNSDIPRVTIVHTSSQYSNRVQLDLPKVDVYDNGTYSCSVTQSNGKYLFKNISFIVATPMAPRILHTNMKGESKMNTPDKLELICNATGIPKPSITWYKDEARFIPSEPNRIEISVDKQTIIFLFTAAKDEGTYKCEVQNKMGVTSVQMSVKFKNIPGSNYKGLIGIIAFLSVLFIIAIIYILAKIRKERELQRELKKLGLANFAKGAVENINPELGLDDQAELLPYDQKWEFPIENLKLGKQLGSGAFGVVMKGEAKNIVEEESVSTVAVKMVKKNADQTYIKALASELKIMVHLGKHLNIVNLLGACTKNVAKRELLVIVEYCRFGNLQNYLLRHRDLYIDQVDPVTGNIDYEIGQEYQMNRSYSVSSDVSTAQSPLIKYAALTFSNGSSHPIVPPPNSGGEYREKIQTGSGTSELTTIPEEEGVITSNNSVQPEWRSNYKGDYKGDVKPIFTRDLLGWAFQIARGMEYLASRKVLHGDLAARNILLSENNIVKICDFGLAKSMYNNDNYKKRGNGPLPLKWMAIESIGDRIFSTQSDVWSFGVVLWEFFSLGRTPYPGIEANERLYEKLLDGFRMSSPQYAPKEIYNMMTRCWASKPLTRPSFTKLSEQIGLLIEEHLRNHYIALNDPYLLMNTQRLESGQSDYLAMLCPPTFEALSSPHYVNGDVGQQFLDSPPADSGYLSMGAVFSPRVAEGQVFDFNVNNRKQKNSEDGTGSELIPMLPRTSISESDTPLQNSVSNPSYHTDPIVPGKAKNKAINDTDIVKTADNYVNMPQNKTLIKEEMNPSNNPFVNSETGDSHYVNGSTRDWGTVQM